MNIWKEDLLKGIENYKTDIDLILEGENISLNNNFNDFDIVFSPIYDGETFKFLGLTCFLLKNGMRINFGFLPQKILFKKGISGKEKVYKKIEKFVELIKGELFFKLSKNKEKYYFEVEGKDFIWNCVKDVNLNDNGLTISLKWNEIYNLNGEKLTIDLDEISFLVAKIFKEDG